ncbi:MAG: malto-oligosyltrehalose synthase, partial [Nanoarchaeota archaeon]
KGFEDTALYRYTRLLSLNEVGGDPAVFGIPLRKFHKFNSERTRTPLTMNATSTHDTKRGEDIRARLNVLSEMPNEWGRKLNKWHRLNKGKRPCVVGREEEYYLYQTMLGSFPFYKKELNNYKKRLKEHMVKALREAGEKTSWVNHDASFENSLSIFIENIFMGKRFMDDFMKFQEKLAFYGVFNSLSQLIIKITSPGVPDFYQGTELWDLNLTDPDNRRNVDFDKRKKYFDDNRDFKKLLKNYRNGKIKLHLTKKALEVRGKDKELYTKGRYVPLEVEGMYKSNIIAYARNYKGRWAIVVVPRCLSYVSRYPDFPLGENWKDTKVNPPSELKGRLKDNFTGRQFDEKGISVAKALKDLPVAILSKC